MDLARDINILEEYSKKNNNISLDNALKCTMYLESEMKAIELFELYLSSTQNIKQDIINYIQKIFNGEMIVEELLAKYNITLKSSYQYLKKKNY